MIPYLLAALGGYLIGQSRKDEQFADGGMTAKGGVKRIKLYHHKTSGGAEYLCSDKVKGTKDEGDLRSEYIVRIDGAKTQGGELKMTDEMPFVIRSSSVSIDSFSVHLYYHKTSGGAEYLCSSKVKGTKDEGSLDSKWVVRIDGAKTHGGELMIKD
jgi:hypothetical protein